jgi:molecular chaperone DnaK
MTTLIERNTTIPTKKSEIFSTAADNQTAVDIHVLQGERKMAGDNMTLGRFRLEGIPPAPRGVPQIEVTFDIDANGILNVSAKDTATGREQRITITASTNLTKDEIDTMVNEAETHAEEDARRRQKVEIKNQADSLAYQSERTLSDLGDKIESVQRGRIESLVSDLRDAIAQEDEERMQQLMGELQQEMYKVSQAAYGDGQPQGQPQGQPEGGATGSGSGGKDSGVVEGEYTVE